MILNSEDVTNEIMLHKWLVSEKMGRDIGFEAAARDWLSRHFGDWLKHRLFESSRILFLPTFAEALKSVSESHNVLSVDLIKKHK